ncbi:hypothetical protein [Collinsella sp. D33t1_170424_A12]|uniref:hypothetical protein n=1 Tax=Collinsella sp. D33t1_170424_A12 TaxID=2787135 RepID=UPI001898B23E|nr:hypothetical protein [Collinsella sp. D33t1_170424_A12]
MNRKTALVAIAGALAALGILMALVGPSGGNVKSVERIAQSTDHYTEADILAAFNAIETEFASEFEGCTLEEVRYDSEVETRHLDEMLEHGQKGKGDLIVVLSKFTTDWRAADEGLSPHDRYEDWQWILIRPSQDAPWKIVDWGY